MDVTNHHVCTWQLTKCMHHCAIAGVNEVGDDAESSFIDSTYILHELLL